MFQCILENSLSMYPPSPKHDFRIWHCQWKPFTFNRLQLVLEKSLYVHYIIYITQVCIYSQKKCRYIYVELDKYIQAQAHMHLWIYYCSQDLRLIFCTAMILLLK